MQLFPHSFLFLSSSSPNHLFPLILLCFTLIFFGLLFSSVSVISASHVQVNNSVSTIVSCSYCSSVCSYLALSFVLLFSDQSSVATVCDKKVLINQYHSPNVITFLLATPQYGKEKDAYLQTNTGGKVSPPKRNKTLFMIKDFAVKRSPSR